MSFYIKKYYSLRISRFWSPKFFLFNYVHTFFTDITLDGLTIMKINLLVPIGPW